MKKTSKILAVLLLATMLISAFALTVNAMDFSPSNYKGNSTNTNVQGITDFGNSVIKIVATAGSIISVVVLVVLGIKYMMGSAEEKAEYKKTLLPYIIGAALVFAASGIATIVFNFTKNIGG